MKILTLLFTFTFITFSSFAQSAADIPSLTFKSEEDYRKYEGEVLKSADLVLNTPLNEREKVRERAVRFILRWMEGTPDYSFALGEDFINLTKGNEDLPGVYLSALVKAALDNRINGEAINAQGRELFLDYCANENNKVKPNKKVKKLLKARQKKGR